MPLYLRSHSRGEYVFDYSWAEAYHRHGLAYYPKLVTSIPFTPVTGPRWRGDLSAASLWSGVKDRMAEHQASGWHLLFPDAAAREQLQELPLVSRQACHFRWLNRDYRDFEDFLGQFQSRKRKNLRKERRRVQEQGLTITRHHGDRISASDWAFFYQCYASTYLKRGQLPYLNEAFFSAVGERLSEQLMLVLARDGERPVAAALYFSMQSVCTDGTGGVWKSGMPCISSCVTTRASSLPLSSSWRRLIRESRGAQDSPWLRAGDYLVHASFA